MACWTVVWRQAPLATVRVLDCPEQVSVAEESGCGDVGPGTSSTRSEQSADFEYLTTCLLLATSDGMRDCGDDMDAGMRREYKDNQKLRLSDTHEINGRSTLLKVGRTWFNGSPIA